MGVVSASSSVNMLVLLLLASLVAGFAQGSSVYYPAIHYPAAFYPTAGRTHYSYAPVTHSYGNVDQSVGTGYLYTRLPADIPYGEQTREAYSYSAPTPVYAPGYAVYPTSFYPTAGRTHYSYVPVTHAYGNVDYAVGTPLMASRPPADILYGQRDGRSYSTVVPGYALGTATPFMYKRADADSY